MKNFNYTARDRAGATKRGSLKAIDRNAALHELAAQGMVPLLVTESSGVEKTSWVLSPRVLMIGLLLLVVCFAFWQLCFKTTVPQAEQQITAKSKNDRNQSNVKGGSKKNIVSVQPKAEGSIKIEKGAGSIAVKSTPPISNNPLAPILDEKSAPVADLLATNKPQRYFSSGTEQIISGFANTKPGNPPPPLLNLPMGENVMEILNRDIVVYNEDNDRAVEIKENTARMKQALKDYIKEGGSPETFLAYYHNELAKDYNEWKSAQQHVVKLLQDGDSTSAESYAIEQNTKFKDRGIKSVVLPANLLNTK